MPPFLLPLLAAPFAGSVVGVLVRRLPAGRPVALDRSRCEACGHALGPPDLVPVASFLLLRGRCRHCGAPIAPMHLWLELAALGVAVLAATLEPDAAWLWADCLLGWWLLALGTIDWLHLLLPDALTLPLLLAGLAATAWLDPDALGAHAAAAAAGYAALRLLAAGYRAWRGRDGLGGGDAKLLAAAGAWVGPGGLGPVLLVASLCGLAIALARRQPLQATTVVPLGCGLAVATFAVRLLLP